VGVGYALFARNGERQESRCRLALQASLADLAQRLRTDIRERLARVQGALGDALALFERVGSARC
jgi:hypothetical protein